MHRTSAVFWRHYGTLTAEDKILADKAFALLRENPNHPSLNFKRVNRYRSVRVSRNVRALALPCDDGLLWFWIGSHEEYDGLLK